jgi:hypothetical protein
VRFAATLFRLALGALVALALAPAGVDRER